MKKPLHWVGVLLIGGVAIALGKGVGGYFAEPDQDELLKAAMTKGIQLINTKAPMKIDEFATLVRAEQGPGSNVIVHYELAKFDEWGASADLAAWKADVLETVCTMSKQPMAKTLSMGVVYNYVYHDERGKEVYRFKIGMSDCT
ncbi:hypothetical protein [Pseudomonas oryzicola]|uniref:Uncharacterized protein n=1 Tax=Pseudomonas oryzicola TaxID=485876 RepID=A0ABS6QDF0_9PSED|nr:hypothetical protein [Pseudomonas oryzicola]MBV4492216.1 hypothetical protein [Pseudomonas oryzicola]